MISQPHKNNHALFYLMCLNIYKDMRSTFILSSFIIIHSFIIKQHPYKTLILCDNKKDNIKQLL